MEFSHKGCSMEEKKFDVAVIGSGPGGYPAAIRLAQKGLKVCLIEGKEIGGTCLNCGCIPTKALIANAEVLYNIRKGKDFGIDVGDVKINFASMQTTKDITVSKLRSSLQGLIQANGITIIQGWAKFTGKNKIQVGNTTIHATNTIIATGSEPKEIR